jgi:hypothetical protein
MNHNQANVKTTTMLLWSGDFPLIFHKIEVDKFKNLEKRKQAL